MFTGIIEGIAEVKSVSKAKREGADTTISVKLGRMASGLKVGDSVCINGACLTVTRLQKKKNENEAQFEMVAETVRRTSLGLIKPGDMVNIERSMKIGDRLEGHFVLGHVDGTATIVDKLEKPKETTIWFRLDNKALAGALVSKGSIAVDGISLTVVDVKKEKFSVSLIPHTLDVTALGLKKKGDKVNIETDVLSKYVSKNVDR
jgi:riboflavin synthase